MSRRFEGFADRIKAQPLAASETTGDDENLPGNAPKNSNEKENSMPDNNNEAAISAATQAGHTAGFQAATDRMNAVFASEHYKGREASAGKLLTKASLLNATSDDIIDLMADMPKSEEATALSVKEQKEAAEEEARKVMKAELENNKNSETNADGGKAPSTDASNAAVWDAAIARVS